MPEVFDEVIDRRNTGSEKWDHCDELFGGENLLPLWVADMDFRTHPEVIEALSQKASHGIFGYSSYMDSTYDSVISWFLRRHEWVINREWIQYSPGVVPALNLIVQTFTDICDGVIIQRPVYHPFMKVIENNNRKVLNNPLRQNSSGYYEIDFDHLRHLAQKPAAKMMILCSPHNPAGRVWTESELNAIIGICAENNILLVSDEIHCDLTFNGYKHIPVHAIAGGFKDNIITCTAPSKTFNLAGIQISNVIISGDVKMKKFQTSLLHAGMLEPNSFAPVAMEAAYNYGEPWLGNLLNYVYGNYGLLKKIISDELNLAEVTELQGTYLAWVDFRKYKLSNKELNDLFIKKAGVAPSPGYVFGPEGSGFMRFNLACPRSVLEEGMEKISSAFKNVK
jgi:cystathionine beta-lyase